MIRLTDILNESVVTCDKCNWHWNISDGGNQPYLCHKCGHDNTPIGEDLRKWFGKGKTGSTTGGGWDRYNTKGEKVGKCGDSKEGEPYVACLSQEKAKKLGKDGIAAFVKRKRAAQKDAGDAKKGGEQKKGQKPTFVKTGASEGLEEKWSQKYKKSINCNNPKGFSQKAHCQGRKKNEVVNEDLFGTSLKMKPYEALMVKSVVSFMMDKYGFNAKIIVKKKDKAGMIGDISLNSNSVDNNKFYLHFNPNQSYKRIIQSMLHELTHVKQVSKNELLPNKDYTAILWKGKEYITAKEYGKLMKSDIASYMKLPWEIEADTNMKTLYSTFINSKYWKGLKGKDTTLDFIIDNI